MSHSSWRQLPRYHTRRDTQLPDYLCQADGIRTATPICQVRVWVPKSAVTSCGLRIFVDEAAESISSQDADVVARTGRR
jgi:hypothetical protein